MRLTDVSVIDTVRSHENCEKVWGWASCAQHTAQGKDFELILTVKMETRHSLGGSFGSKFSESVIIAELWRPEVARPGNFVSNFCVFFRKIFKILFVQFTWRHRQTLLHSNVVEFVRWEIMRYLPTKNRNLGYLSNCRYCADRTQNLPRPAPNIWLTLFIEIGSLSAEL